MKGSENQKLDVQKTIQSILQANEVNSNLNNVSFNGKHGLLEELILKRESSIDLKKNLNSRNKSFSNNDENNFKGTLSSKINSLLLKSQIKLSNTKQSELNGGPISPSSISSSSPSSMSSSVSSSSCKISSLSEQKQIKIKDDESLDSFENNQNSKSDSSKTIGLKSCNTNESGLEVITKESIYNSQIVKGENFDSYQGEEDVEKNDEHLVIDLKDENVPNESMALNDNGNGDDLKNDKQTNDGESHLTVKESLSGDLNNSKSSSSTNESLPILCSKVNSRDKHVCRYCFKSFPRSANLTRHLRTHTGT